MIICYNNDIRGFAYKFINPAVKLLDGTEGRSGVIDV